MASPFNGFIGNDLEIDGDENILVPLYPGENAPLGVGLETMAEVLVRAAPHWMDSLSQTEIDRMTPAQLANYNARTQIGDIIVVEPDGWIWGKEEGLPTFIVIRLPEISFKTAKFYEDALYDNTDPLHPILLKRRKYRVPPALIETAIGQGISQISLTNTVFSGNLIAKVS